MADINRSISERKFAARRAPKRAGSVGASVAEASLCPVEHLAREAVRLHQSYSEADHRETLGGNRAETMLLWDRMQAVEEMASTQAATSAAGAMFQLMLVLDDLETIEAERESAVGENGDGPSYSFGRALRLIEHNVTSTIGVLESVSGVDRMAVGGGFYMSNITAPAAGEPDAELLKLAEELEENQRQRAAFDHSGSMDEEPHYNREWELREAIDRSTVRSAKGLGVLARAFEIAHAHDVDVSCTGEGSAISLAVHLARDAKVMARQ